MVHSLRYRSFRGEKPRPSVPSLTSCRGNLHPFVPVAREQLNDSFLASAFRDNMGDDVPLEYWWQAVVVLDVAQMGDLQEERLEVSEALLGKLIDEFGWPHKVVLVGVSRLLNSSNLQRRTPEDAGRTQATLL